MEQQNRVFSLNRNQLKYLVIIAMLIDHLAWAFVPTDSVQGQAMHFIGRLTGPVMAFFLVEGYMHTRNLKKYAMRLGMFALVSWPAFVYFEAGIWPVFLTKGSESLWSSALNIYFPPLDCVLTIIPAFGVIYTLFLALLALWVYDKAPWDGWMKGVVIAILCLLSMYGDWPIFDIMFALVLFRFHDEPKKKWTIFYIVSILLMMILFGMVSGELVAANLFQTGIFLVPPLLQFAYNGEGGSKKPFHKWFFYLFYPLHLLLLGYIKYGMKLG